MTQYEVTEKRLPEYGKTFTVHPKFGHYQTPCVTWVCLVTGENQSKYFALSNLKEVEKPVAVKPHDVLAVDMDMVFTCAVPDYTPELPPYMKDHIQALTEILNTRNPERQASRDLYVYELGYEIAEALAA